MNYYEDQMTLDEGPLCLDFANSLDWHASPNPVETITDYPALVRWAEAKSILQPAEANRLLEAASVDPRQAELTRQEGLMLREALYRIFVAAGRDELPSGDDMKVVETWAARMLPRRRLVLKGREPVWEWEPLEDQLDAMLAPVVVSAVNLVTSPELHRVGQCADDRGCGFLFMDTTRNHTRQWCSMDGCGNRAKARRHYQRSRQLN